MKLDTWEIESAARAGDAGKIIEIFTRQFPELQVGNVEWVIEAEDTLPPPNLIITVVTPTFAATYVKGAFRATAPSFAKYMRVSGKPYLITIDGL